MEPWFEDRIGTLTEPGAFLASSDLDVVRGEAFRKGAFAPGSVSVA